MTSQFNGKLFWLIVAAATAAGFSSVHAVDLGPGSPGQTGTLNDFPEVSDDLLGAVHGKDAGISYNLIGQNTLTASANGTVNAEGNINSGSVTFSGNAMQNFQGMSNFVANTGNNNSLQAAMVLNVSLH